MSWFDFRSDYIYCDRCGCLLDDYLTAFGYKFCCDDCKNNYLTSMTMIYPYGILFDEVLYKNWDEVVTIWNNNTVEVD